MSDYLCNSVVWSVVWFTLGGLFGSYLRGLKGQAMTTPERLRARQRRESAAVAVLAVLLVGSTIYSAREDAQQNRCLSSFVNSQTETTSIRSSLVARESEATRQVITATLAATDRAGVTAAQSAYTTELAEIDAVRKANPVRTFPEGACR